MNNFNEIIGYEQIKEKLNQIIDMFNNKELYEKVGARIPKGVMLYGEPGLGKTLFCKEFIKKCNVKTFYIVKDKENAETLNHISDTFEEASKEDRAIIFIDDLDKFSENSRRTDTEAFAAIQSGIDKISNKDILVLATVNNYDKLPVSLVRSGRFDIKIEVDLPTKEDGKKIIEHYLANKKTSVDLKIDDVANMVAYSSCSDLETLINDSAIYSAYKRKDSIDIHDIIHCYLSEDVVWNLENKEMDDEYSYEVALHEAGHTTIAEALKPNSVGFVYIQTKANGGGKTRLCKDFSRRCDTVALALGGRESIKLKIANRIPSGCGSDLNKASELVGRGIGYNGNFGLNLLNIADSAVDSISEKFKEELETATAVELDRYSNIARSILIENNDFLEALTTELKEKKILVYSDIQRIKEAHPIKPFHIDF